MAISAAAREPTKALSDLAYLVGDKSIQAYLESLGAKLNGFRGTSMVPSRALWAEC